MITVNYPLLREKLAQLSAVIPVRSALPQLSCVKMQAAEGKLHLCATDMDRRLSLSLPVDGDLQPVCVDLAKLRAISISGDAKLSQVAGSVKIEASGIRASIQSLAASEFPEAIAIPDKGISLFDDALINENLEWVNKASSTDESNYALTGIRVDGGMMVASNRHMILSAACPDLGIGITVPRNSISIITGIDSAERSAKTDGSKLEVRGNSVVFTTSLIEAPFPNWKPLVSTQASGECHVWSFDSATMIKVLKDSSSLWRSTMSSAVLFRGSGKHVELEAGGQDASSVIEIAGVGGEPFRCNGNYMLAALSGFDGEVEMQVYHSCCKIEQDGRMCVIMKQFV